MGKGAVVHLAIFGLFFLFSPKVALSEARTTAPQPAVRTARIPDIKISAAAGYIVETHAAPADPSSPTVLVHIQEAHTNYEAQQNIVKILEQLVNDYGLKLILVEGSAGDVSLAHLRHYSPADHRKRIAEQYLQAGLISGEEYLDLVSDHPLILWGIEDEALYQENVEAFLGSEPLQDALRPELASVREAAEALRPALLSAALNTLDAQVTGFDRQEITLAEYATTLEQLAKQQGVALGQFPHLQGFLALRDQEEGLSRKETQAEQRLLLAEISSRLPQETFDGLMAKAKALQAGTINAIDFYAALEAAAEAAKISLGAFPHLAGYVQYLRASAAVSTTELDGELERCVGMLRERLAATPESRELRAILDTLDLLAKLLDFDLSPEDYRRLTASEPAAAWSRWEQFLEAQLAAAGLPRQPLEGLRKIGEQLPALQRFYEVARQRDEVMVRNALDKLRDSGEPLAVLITGGFHSPRITAMLKDHGIPTIMLIPKISHATNDRLYRAVVRYKSGQGGSFEEVMDLANQATAKRTTAEAVRP